MDYERRPKARSRKARKLRRERNAAAILKVGPDSLSRQKRNMIVAKYRGGRHGQHFETVRDERRLFDPMSHAKRKRIRDKYAGTDHHRAMRAAYRRGTKVLEGSSIFRNPVTTLALGDKYTKKKPKRTSLRSLASSYDGNTYIPMYHMFDKTPKPSKTKKKGPATKTRCGTKCAIRGTPVKAFKQRPGGVAFTV